MKHASLYVAKTDGTREVLGQVSLEMARAIFTRLDWIPEAKAAEAALEAGGEIYVPEFGLADDEERRLFIEPGSGETVTFVFERPDHWWQMPDFPKREVDRLLELYFADDDEGIREIFEQARPPMAALQIRELSDAEFEQTKTGGMRRVVVAERQAHVREYLSACIEELSLQTSLETIELMDIFISGDKCHSHLLFNYGDPATAFVVVVQHDPDLGDSVLGHHFVSLAVSDYPP